MAKFKSVTNTCPYFAERNIQFVNGKYETNDADMIEFLRSYISNFENPTNGINKIYAGGTVYSCPIVEEV